MALDIDRLTDEVVRGTQLLIDRAVAKIAEENAALRKDVEGLTARLAEVEARAPVPGPEGPMGPPGKDGADGAPGRDGIDGKDGEPGKDGRDGIDGKDGADGAPGRDGADGAPGRDGADGVAGRDGIDGKDGVDGRDGKLPLVRAWSDGVHYEGDCVTFGGATWQAQRDTGRQPPHEDWICLAAPGRDGRSFTFRGTYDAAETYQALDVVAMDGGSFVAMCDEPGECSGPNWKLIVQRGKPGQRGEKGERGDMGPKGRDGAAGPALIAASVSEDGVLSLVREDGHEVTADFYDVLRRVK
jgi:hypothetical protein